MWKNLAYPVRIEALTATGDWELVFLAETSDDMEFRMSSYLFDNRVPVYRLIASDGFQVEQTTQDLADYHDYHAQQVIEMITPLQKFCDVTPQNALESAGELIQGGLRSQHFVILPRSYVLINHPNLHHLRIIEFDNAVNCRIHTSATEYGDIEPQVTIWKRINSSPDNAQEINVNFSFTPDHRTVDGMDETIPAFLTLICSAIVRDFWVLEERIRRQKYELRVKKQSFRTGKGKNRKRVKQKEYIWIPRFRYNLSLYKKDEKKVKHQTRVTLSPAWVSGHIRKLPNGHHVSQDALANARRFGIKLTDGETFVRPHNRGEIEQLKTYRSRSAFEMLFKNKELSNV